ncbi:hypothetical protein [Cognataquiflexum aquatile]|uniref:hypothetical protein n=1 Tax=Cognataquiflexum aquatile TaxID=2249427 RepID=UPI000DE8F009|nr:hypothetical protein [Cognataquiflexum aquatile]
MSKFVSNFKWIMLICGLLTCSMFLGLFSPEASLNSNFGEPLVTGPENVVVRGWSALIGLTGIMLIYGAFKPAVRAYSLVIAGISKTIFVILVLSFGSQYMSFGAGTAVIVDIIMILLFVLYLLFSKSAESTQPKI